MAKIYNLKGCQEYNLLKDLYSLSKKLWPEESLKHGIHNENGFLTVCPDISELEAELLESRKKAGLDSE